MQSTSTVVIRTSCFLMNSPPRKKQKGQQLTLWWCSGWFSHSQGAKSLRKVGFLAHYSDQSVAQAAEQMYRVVASTEAKNIYCWHEMSVPIGGGREVWGETNRFSFSKNIGNYGRPLISVSLYLSRMQHVKDK